VSISLRYVPALDIARTHFDGAASAGSSQSVSELRIDYSPHRWVFGHTVIEWNKTVTLPAAQLVSIRDFKTLASEITSHEEHGYSLQMRSPGHEEDISASWTRGLVLHPISAVIIFVALLLSLSQHLTVTLFASLTSFLAAFFVLVAFLCDIALFAYLKRRASKLDNVVESTKPGPGFWMTLASFIVLLFAGCTVCLGRRHDRRHAGGTGLATNSDAHAANAADARPWYKRFGRNKY
ncbi:hypothetical protein FRC11_003112, partial [Ceratobasidium sp. 423]